MSCWAFCNFVIIMSGKPSRSSGCRKPSHTLDLLLKVHIFGLVWFNSFILLVLLVWLVHTWTEKQLVCVCVCLSAALKKRKGCLATMSLLFLPRQNILFPEVFHSSVPAARSLWFHRLTLCSHSRCPRVILKPQIKHKTDILHLKWIHKWDDPSYRQDLPPSQMITKLTDLCLH